MSENGEANTNTSPKETNVSRTFSPKYLTVADLTSQSADDARQELSVQLEDLLNTLSNKFAGVSSEIFAKSKALDGVYWIRS